MPRRHKRVPGSRKYADYSKEILIAAVNDVKNGLSYKKAEEKYGITGSTIFRALKNKHPLPYGRQSVLTKEEEEKLEHGILLASDWGLPFDSLDVRLIVKKYLDDQGKVCPRFKNNLPGKDWFLSFKRRHESLSVRLSENIKRSRASVDKKSLERYFENIKIVLDGVTPDKIINFDETNMSDDPGRSKVVVRRGAKHAERILDTSKSSISIMFAGTASGVVLSPFVVYKSKNLYDTWTTNGPKGCKYGCSKSGWFDGNLFEKWFFQIVLPYFKSLHNEGSKVLIGDNLSSHLSLSVIEACENNNIRFAFLPPNSTHLCQPLDVSFFHPLKVSWRKTLLQYKQKYKGCIPKTFFPSYLKATLDKLENASKNLKAGFKATGLHPFDPQQVLKRLPSEEKLKSANESWSNAFINVLKEVRFGQGEIPKTRKRKIVTQPGQAVTLSDLTEELSTSASKGRRKNDNKN